MILALLLAVGLAAPAAAAGGGGTITGQVINGTPGGGSAAGLEVVLVTYLNSKAQADQATTLTDSEGNFTFSGLNTGQEYSYAAAVGYQEVTYVSFLSNGDLPAFAPGETNLNIVISVYETTRDGSHVLLMLDHMVLFPKDGSVLVSEYYLFANSDNRTFVGKDGDAGVLYFSMPPGAAGLQMNYGPGQDQVVSTADGFWDTAPMPPGGSEVGYTYSLALPSGRLDLTRPVDYPTAQLDILAPQGSLDISGAGLVAEAPATISGTVFSHYSAQDLVPGDELSLFVSRPSGGGPSAIWWVVIGVLVVILAPGLVYLFRRRRPAAAPVASGDVPRQQQLLGELAALDDSFDAGDIDEETYRKQRDQKKAELTRLMRSRRGN